ncbi:glycosyltransferase family 4 protein [Cognatitamlana onchidii]|uniref:glycosyltransferase family 4 protein n=1 Tax=Cognatitamlana onchidii TaxID=2562860 RepID=UPI0010A6693D|nr:glycosyltransferase family 4 protein [Algibacter onchidii]
MKRITVLLPKVTKPKTGGQKYDIYLVNKLKDLHGEIVTVTDKTFSIQPKVALIYNFIYSLKLNSFLNADVLITNSRMYPRQYLFLKILKIFSKNIKLIVIHHHYNYKVKSGLTRKIHRYFELRFLKGFDLIIIPSRYVKNETKRLFPEKALRLLEIAFEKSSDLQVIKKHPEPNLLYIGTIESRKGIHLLIESLKEVKEDFQLKLVGAFKNQDPYYLMLKSKIEEGHLEDKITFCGRVSDEQMKDYLKEASIFVFPSLHEGYGMVMVEAMSYGLPVIAFNNSAIPFVIKDKHNGLLVENENIYDLTAKIRQILSNEALLKKLSKNAQSTYKNIRKFDDLNLEIELFYNELIDES